MIPPPKHFLDDLDRFGKALHDGGWLVVIDGQHYIDNDAPEALTRPYKRLVQHGYANGYDF